MTLLNVLEIALYLAALGILMGISVIDARTRRIPNALNLALFACGILAIFIVPQVSIASRLIGAVCVSVPLFLIDLMLPDAFGGGDIKLMAAAGFLLGWPATLVAAFIGICIGGVYGAYLLLLRKKGPRQHFAFGPALCCGIALSLFFGSPLIAWYLSM